MCKSLRILILCLFAGWSLGALAVPTPVACSPDESFYQGGLTVTIPAQSAPGQTFSGLVHPHARVGVFTEGGHHLAVALDSDNPAARRLDVLRFDFTGSGTFTKAQSVHLLYNNGQSASIRATTLQCVHNNVTYPVKVTGDFSQDADAEATLRLTLTAAIQDTCMVGDKQCTVRIIDSAGTLNFSDVYTPWDGVTALFQGSGDAVYVDTGDGSFANAATLRKGYYGHPIYLENGWYTIALAEDGSKITATPFTGPLGRVKMPAVSWSADLVGKKYVFTVADLPQDIAIPADHYMVNMFGEQLPAVAPATTPLKLTCFYTDQNKVKVIDVLPDTLNEPKLGGPAIAVIHATRDGDTMTFSFALTDSTGDAISIGAANTKIADRITFVVHDAEGHVVHASSFEHG